MAAKIPPQAHVLAAQIEDNLTTWSQRDPLHHHPETRRAGERACKLLDDLIVVLHQARERIAAEIGEYDDARRRLR